MTGASERPTQAHPGIFDHHLDGGNRFDEHGIHFTEPHVPGLVRRNLSGGENVDNVSFPGMVEGGYLGAYANAYPAIDQATGGRAPKPEEFWGEYRLQSGEYERAVALHPDIAALVGNRKELESAISSGRIALIKSIEGVHVSPDASGLETIERLAKDGVRSFGIVYNFDNVIGTPHQYEEDRGLSAFGRDVVDQLANMPGVVIDVSHASAKTASDTLKIAGTGKVIASHSSARGLNAHTRNLPDDVAIGIGERGIISVPLHSKFVKPERTRNDDSVKADVYDVIRHIMYLRDLLGGTENIGLGTDFGGMNTAATIFGLDNISTFGQTLYDAMKKSGEFGEEEIEGIFGQNALNHLAQSLPK